MDASIQIALVGALVANIIGSAVGIVTMLRMAREQGLQQGALQEKIAGHSRQLNSHAERLNGHGARLGAVEVGLAGYVGKEG